MKVIFGVMSNKWEMEAEDMKVAKLAMMLHLGKSIPIAIYSHEKESFTPSMEFLRNNMDYKRDKVSEAVKSIKICRKGAS